MKKTIILLVALLLAGCGDNKTSTSNLKQSSFLSLISTSSSSSSSTSLISSSVVTESDKIQNFKNSLSNLNSNVSSLTYTTSQEDYYGISIETKEEGVTTLYNDNFIVKEFNQTIGSSTTEGKVEMGIDENIYQFTYYDENTYSFNYYENNESNREMIFNIGFVNEYINNILNVTLSYLKDDSNKLSLITNFDQIDFSIEGEVKLQYRLISFAPNGKDKLEEVQRDDILNIENGKILSSNTIMLYSLQDGVNYYYMEKSVTYNYDELVDYEGEHLYFQYK